MPFSGPRLCHGHHAGPTQQYVCIYIYMYACMAVFTSFSQAHELESILQVLYKAIDCSSPLNIKVSQLLLLCGFCGSGVLGLTISALFSQSSRTLRHFVPFFVPCTPCIRFSTISLMIMGSQYVGHGWDMVRGSA